MNNQKTVPINFASIFHRRKIISYFFFPDVCCGCHTIPRCLDAIYHILPDHFHQGSKYTSRLIPRCASSVCQNLHLLQSRHLRHCQQKIQDCHPKDNSLREEREWFGLYTHAKGAMKAYVIQKQAHERLFCLSMLNTCAVMNMFAVVYLISFRFNEKKTHLSIKTSLLHTVLYFGGTASLISFVLPFSDNHFSNKKNIVHTVKFFVDFYTFWRFIPKYLICLTSTLWNDDT